MSRIGNKPISIPKGVEVRVDGSTVAVKGPLGQLVDSCPRDLEIEATESEIIVRRPSDDKKLKALHGLTASKIANMVDGVTKGYTKELEIVGVGYRAAKQGKTLVLNMGFSRPVNITPAEGVEIEVPNNNKIIVKGIDKQKVGDLAARIRRVFPPEPYKGKGIKYKGEQIRRKMGKAAK
ncbi:MAG: 50S ribosomal protein L6 [Dethiobacteria bacterium]|jgi:large subunit ribosomal protein L6